MATTAGRDPRAGFSAESQPQVLVDSGVWLRTDTNKKILVYLKFCKTLFFKKGTEVGESRKEKLGVIVGFCSVQYYKFNSKTRKLIMVIIINNNNNNEFPSVMIVTSFFCSSAAAMHLLLFEPSVTMQYTLHPAYI